METEINQSNFIWYSLRFSFWIMIILWVLSTVYPIITYPVNLIEQIIWIISGFFTFVASIIHLNKYEKKAFAITALVISSLFVILVFIGFIIGIGY